MTVYQKISGLYKFDSDTRSYTKDFTSPELEALGSAPIWDFTEKIDGTNIRVIWDGYRVSFAGRTDNTQLPPRLLAFLTATFGGPDNERLFEQKFGEANVVLYGEGYGAGIQRGGNYRDDQALILFDVKIDGLFLLHNSVEDIANYFGVDVVPLVATGWSIYEAIDLVSDGYHSHWQNNPNTVHYAEGLVGVTAPGLLNRRGERIAVKIKRRDLHKSGRGVVHA
jgi:hypothetical protein